MLENFGRNTYNECPEDDTRRRWVTEINSNGLKGIENIASSLNIRRSSRQAELVEEVWYEILNSKNESEYDSELTDAIANQYMKIGGDFGIWSHSLCHLFETYGSNEASLYDKKTNKSTLTKLIQETVNRANSLQNTASTPRMLGPLAKYNLDMLDISDLDKSFIYKPEIEGIDEYVELLDPEYNQKIIEFFNSNSPREYCVKLISMNIAIPVTEESKMLEILWAIEEDVNKDVMSAYFEEHTSFGEDSTMTYEEFVDNRNIEIEGDLCKGAYIDVDGTIIGRYNTISNEIVDKINEMAKIGMGITIFTGANPEDKTKFLKDKGFPTEYLPVRSKTDFKGKNLELLLDDSRPEFQGFGAVFYIHPNELAKPDDDDFF